MIKHLQEYRRFIPLYLKGWRRVWMPKPHGGCYYYLKLFAPNLSRLCSNIHLAEASEKMSNPQTNYQS